MNGQGSVTLTSCGHALDTRAEVFGELRDSSDIAMDGRALRERMDAEGYLFLRGLLRPELVLEARARIIDELVGIGEIDTRSPRMSAVASGESRREEVGAKAFARSLRKLPAVKAMCHQDRMLDVYARLFAEPALGCNYIWVRTMPVGRATPSHSDWVFLCRGSERLYTSWFPIGDVPRTLGSMAVLEGSHQTIEQHREYIEIDVDRDVDTDKRFRCGMLDRDMNAVRRELGGRWLTTDYRVGDVIVFHTRTVHATLDNQGAGEKRIRISCDTIYQPASEPMDARFAGPDPGGHTSSYDEKCRALSYLA
jgi:ectoine hydroxylase-related dioxygenase (phytanoyl-CoA dioxygenase family)